MAPADHRPGLPTSTAPEPHPGAHLCVFCDIIAGRVDQGVCIPVGDGFVVFPAKHQRPRNYGHMLLVPTDHYTTLEQLPANHNTAWLTAVAVLGAAVRSAFQATGITVRMNLGPPGQDVDHLHTHLIPRHLDDGFATTTSRAVPLADRLAYASRLRSHLAARHIRKPTP